MLRIDFTAEDLTRLRVSGAPDPLWETVLSLHLLQNRQGALVFDPWRRQVRARIAALGLTGMVAALTRIAPWASYFPDFLTPTPAGPTGLEVGVDRVLSTPRRRLTHELARTFGRERPPSWVRRIAAGEPSAMRHLGAALRRYHAVAVAPYEAAMEQTLAADLRMRQTALRAGGAEALVGSYEPVLRREDDALVSRYPVARTLALQDRPLTVVPGFFCILTPVALADVTLDPVLVHPLGPAPGWLARAGLAGGHGPDAPGLGPSRTGDPDDGRPVAQLIGPTRATVLRALERERTTTELARLLRLTPATASRHATVLREAGLVSSERDGNRVRHSRTRLGDALLAGKLA